MQRRNPKVLTINIIIFGLVGLVYFSFFALGKLEDSLFHPLKYGWFGIWFSIVGGLSVIQLYRYKGVTLYKNAIYAIFYSIIYFLGFIIIPQFFTHGESELVQLVWLGILLVSYFITFGALNWYFGFYIALFNIVITVISFLGNMGTEVSPIVWVSIFSFMGITNIYMQWALVIMTTFLGLLEKSFSMFDIFE